VGKLLTLIQVRPWGVLHMSCNHAHRLRLEKLLNRELSRSFNGYFKPLLDPGGGLNFETAARRLQIYGGYIVCNGHSHKGKGVRLGVTAVQRPWPMVKGNGFILVSECSPGIISVPPPGHFASEGLNFN
jgi:hypothetical protein